MRISAKSRDYRDDRAICFGVYRSIDIRDLEAPLWPLLRWI